MKMSLFYFDVAERVMNQITTPIWSIIWVGRPALLRQKGTDHTQELEIAIST